MEIFPPKDQRDDLHTALLTDVPTEREDRSNKVRDLYSYSPLISILYLSIGPLTSRLCRALSGVIESIYVAIALGDKGVQVLGTAPMLNAPGFMNYFHVSLATEISYLYGKGSAGLCSQLYVDMIRISLIIAIIVPCVLLPIVKPVVGWLGMDESQSDWCFQFILPSAIGTFATYLFILACAVNHGEGRSLCYAGFRLLSFALDLGVFQPLFYFVFKTGIWGSQLSNVLANLICAVIMNITFVRGKSAIKPRWEHFKQPISRDTITALKVGFPTLLQSFASIVINILHQRFFTLAATACNNYDAMVMIYGIVMKISQVINGFCMGISLGFIPPAAYAFGAGYFKRLRDLSIHAFWISTAFSAIFSLAISIWPSEIAWWWSTDPTFLFLSESTIPIFFYTGVTFGLLNFVPSFLQGMQYVTRSTVLSIISFYIPLPIFSTILYLTNKTDPARLFYADNFSDAFNVVVSILFIIKPIRVIYTHIINGDSSTQAEEAELETLNPTGE